MTDEKHDRIRSRAYEIWVREGRPDGLHDEHWRQAMREIADEQPGNHPNATSPKLTEAAMGPLQALSGDGSVLNESPIGEAVSRARRTRAPKK